MAEDRAHDPRRVPNSVKHFQNVVRINRPDAQVAFSKEHVVMHHDGQHVRAEGPARMSGKGTAKELGPIFKAIRESHKPND